jgi:hypothetical protein
MDVGHEVINKIASENSNKVLLVFIFYSLDLRVWAVPGPCIDEYSFLNGESLFNLL